MKTFKQITFIFISVLLLNSCNQAEKLSQIDIDTTLKKSITVSSNGSGEISQNIAFDLSEYSEVSPYLDKIKAVKINSAEYKIVSFSDINTVASGVLSVISEDQTFGPFTHDNFLDDKNNQTVYSLDDASKLNIIAAKIKNSKQFSATVSGNVVAEEAFTMVVEVVFDVRVTVQAL